MANDRFVGIALILLGVLFLLPRVSSVELPLDQWWPLFLAIAGLATALNGNLWGGLIAIAVAAAFLVDNLGIVRLDGAGPSRTEAVHGGDSAGCPPHSQ